MATLSEFDGQIAAKLLLISGSAVSGRNASDLEARNAIPLGETRYRLSCYLVTQVGQGAPDSNITYEIAEAALWIAHRLDVGEAELTWRLAGMNTIQSAVLAESWWDALASVHEIVDGPEVSEVPQRVGNVVQFEVITRVKLTPGVEA